MAEVFMARRVAPTPSPELVALKRILPELAGDPTMRLMLAREADLLTRLHHPGLVQARDVSSAVAQGFYTMELIEGLRVPELVRAAGARGVRLPWPLVVELVAQVADALHHAHECRDAWGRPLEVVHCDVSPANLMIDRRGSTKLLDFGIAQTRDHHIDPRQLPRGGTRAYMSPEQRRGERVDRRSDVFSLGLVLWELAVWRRAFVAGSADRVDRRFGRLPAPRSLEPELPSRLDAIVECALSPDPAQRFATAAELGAAVYELRLGHTLRPHETLGAWVDALSAARPLAATSHASGRSAP
jgi:eukaryotic-like serine/threonine-protein kinase